MPDESPANRFADCDALVPCHMALPDDDNRCLASRICRQSKNRRCIGELRPYIQQRTALIPCATATLCKLCANDITAKLHQLEAGSRHNRHSLANPPSCERSWTVREIDETRKIHRANSGISAYDQERWLLPPPRILTTVAAPNGLSAILQTGHSAARTQERQEIICNLPVHCLTFAPDGWQGNETFFGSRTHQGTSAATLFWMPANTSVRWVTQISTRRALHLMVPDKLMNTLAMGRDLSDAFEEAGPIKINSIGSALLQVFLDELSAGTVNGSLALESYVSLLARQAFAPSRTEGMISRTSLGDWRIKRVQDAIESDPGRDFSLVQLAAIAELSPAQFLRRFRLETGVNPHAWLMRRRNAHGRIKLADPHLSITAIAFMLGFSSSQHFATAFRREFGMTPSAYRRMTLS